jgi:hypothetical protein
MTPPIVNSPPGHKPFVPPNVQMKEFTLRAVLLGLVMCVILGAANAYLGLRAGQTIAATYPAAVIGMAVLRIFKGSILEENIARTAGSIGNRSRRVRSSQFRRSLSPARGWIFRRAPRTGNQRR